MDSCYPYSPEWKAQVSKHSESWLTYEAAINALRRYFRTKLRYGKAAAVEEFAVTCHLIGRQGDFGKAQAKRLQETFLLVGKAEGQTIETEVTHG